MTRAPIRFAAGVAGVLMLVIALPALAQRKPQPQTPTPGVDDSVERRALIATGEAPDLFLLYTGDVIGCLDPCG